MEGKKKRTKNKYVRRRMILKFGIVIRKIKEK